MAGKKKVCHKKELLSLIGLLSFACKVVKPGRIFLRRLIDLSMTMTNLEDSCRLSEEAQLDIKWWCNYLRIWNGKSLLSLQVGHVYQVFTDASGLGMEGVCNGSWFSVPWPPQYRNKHINILGTIWGGNIHSYVV